MFLTATLVNEYHRAKRVSVGDCFKKFSSRFQDDVTRLARVSNPSSLRTWNIYKKKEREIGSKRYFIRPIVLFFPRDILLLNLQRETIRIIYIVCFKEGSTIIYIYRARIRIFTRDSILDDNISSLGLREHGFATSIIERKGWKGWSREREVHGRNSRPYFNPFVRYTTLPQVHQSPPF